MTFLVIEDSPTMRQLIRFNLARIPQAQVLEASDGVDGLKKLSSSKVDLILTDINMPIMDGLKLVSLVRSNEAYQGIPIIIITTDARMLTRPCTQMFLEACVIKLRASHAEHSEGRRQPALDKQCVEGGDQFALCQIAAGAEDDNSSRQRSGCPEGGDCIGHGYLKIKARQLWLGRPRCSN